MEPLIKDPRAHALTIAKMISESCARYETSEIGSIRGHREQWSVVVAALVEYGTPKHLDVEGLWSAFVAHVRADDGVGSTNFLGGIERYKALFVEAVNAPRPKHWVFAASEAHREHVAKVNALEGGPHSRKHLTYMLDQIRDNTKFSEAKANRWLGWVQASLSMHGVLSLEEMKAINVAASVAAAS